MSSKMIQTVLVAGILGLGLASQASAQAQDNNRGNPPADTQGGNRGGRPGGRGNYDPAQFRQQMMDRIKERLAAKDDEWQVIQPRLDKVMTLSFSSRTSSRSLYSSRGGSDNNNRDRGPNRIPGSDSAVSRAQQDLQSVLDSPNANADEITARLKALRDARDQAKQDLTKAQAELKELLSARQEAVLVSLGMLE